MADSVEKQELWFMEINITFVKWLCNKDNVFFIDIYIYVHTHTSKAFRVCLILVDKKNLQEVQGY